jgi:hypothetical protein
MENLPQTPQPQEGSQRRISPITVIIAIVAILAVALSVWYLVTPVPGQKNVPALTTVTLKMSPAEQDYLKKIEVGNIALSRAENFLHQEVTAVNGEVFNDGTEPVSGLRLTVEFSDDMKQIVLRETRAVLGSPEQPLAPGERRAFEISFEHIPSSWNMQQPSVRPSYLQLPPHR